MTPHVGPWPMHQAPRCKAKSKRSGERCSAPAVRGTQVCRMHGARGGAPTGKKNGRYRTGQFTQELAYARALVQALARLAKEAEDI